MAATALVVLALLSGPPDLAVPPGPDAPAAPPDLANQIEAALGVIDRPYPASGWRALGPAAVPMLDRIARDPGQVPSRRARALDGLGYIGGESARKALLDVARDERAPVAARRAAVAGAGRALPAAEVAPALTPLLRGAGHGAVRAKAAEVLAERAPAAGCRALREQVAREAESARGAFQRALDRCGEAGR